MNSIEKFVMGKAGAKPVKVSGTDRVMAAILTADDGQQIVVTVALGPDPVKAVLHLPEDLDLKSRHGKCRKIGAGMYEFTADAIDSDILE
jgi:hypothetical protein